MRRVGQRLAHAVDAAVVGWDLRPYWLARRMAAPRPDAPAAVASPPTISLRRESEPVVLGGRLLFMFMAAPSGGAMSSDHRCRASPESGEDHHADMADKEDDQQDRHEEVDGARRLLAAEDRCKQRNTDAIAGDIARPVQIASGSNRKTTPE